MAGARDSKALRNEVVAESVSLNLLPVRFDGSKTFSVSQVTMP